MWEKESKFREISVFNATACVFVFFKARLGVLLSNESIVSLAQFTSSGLGRSFWSKLSWKCKSELHADVATSRLASRSKTKQHKDTLASLFFTEPKWQWWRSENAIVIENQPVCVFLSQWPLESFVFFCTVLVLFCLSCSLFFSENRLWDVKEFIRERLFWGYFYICIM